MKKRTFIFLLFLVGLIALIIYLLLSGEKEFQQPEVSVGTQLDKGENFQKIESNSEISLESEVDSEKLDEKGNREQKKTIITEKDKDIVRERRTMAKMSLASLYSAIFATRADYDRYSTDLKMMGYTIDGFSMGKKVIPVKVGFLVPFHPKELIKNKSGEVIENPLRMSTDHLMKEDPEYQFEYHEDIEGLDLNTYREHCTKGCRVHPEGFEIMAVFPYPNQRGFEVWTIDHNKTIHQKKIDFK